VGRIIIATEVCVRESNTTQYAANEAWANDDTAPTAYVFGELAGLSGTITDAWIVSSNDPATLLQGELWFFDDSTALTNDNAEFALSDADAVKGVGVMPFTLVTSTDGSSGTNSIAHVIDYQVSFDCTNKPSGLYMLVKVKNTYTPASAETLTVRLKVRREAG
jgi:hypothetical protein